MSKKNTEGVKSKLVSWAQLAFLLPLKWEDNIREWTGVEFDKPQRAEENRENAEKWL